MSRTDSSNRVLIVAFDMKNNLHGDVNTWFPKKTTFTR